MNDKTTSSYKVRFACVRDRTNPKVLQGSTGKSTRDILDELENW